MARGTAAMSPENRKKVASAGGKAVSADKAHMAEIGRKGGAVVAKNKAHMAEIGRKGGLAGKGKLRASEARSSDPVEESSPAGSNPPEDNS